MSVAAAPPKTPRARVRSFFADPANVSAAQRRAVFRDGNFFLSACPGSGKTRTVGLRVAWATLDGSERAIAATSYTNTAIREIESAAAKAGVTLGEPHFVGTLHRFLLRYVFLPFGHLVMGCASRPQLVVDPYQRPGQDPIFLAWDTENNKPRMPPASVWEFHFRRNGSLVIEDTDALRRLGITAEEAAKYAQKQALERKTQLAESGIASFSDTMYYAMRVLEQRADVREAVATRFDEIIVDEAQDTTDVQLRCIGLIAATGLLKSLVLVGDLQQAIYGFAGADPTDVDKLIKGLGLQELLLAENYRSSQAICNTTHRFSLRDVPDIARGPDRAFGVPPELLIYKKNPADGVALFDKRLELLGVAPDSARILTRVSSLSERLGGETAAAQASRALDLLIRIKRRLEAGETITKDEIEAVDRLLAWIATGTHSLSGWSGDDRIALRDATMRLLDGLPTLTTTVGEWAAEVRAQVRAALAIFGDLELKPGDIIRTPPKSSALSAANYLLSKAKTDSRVGTIHRSKGESHTAILLIAAPQEKERRAVQWIADPTPETEEVRVAYVALTRAERYCAVALPDSTPDETIDEFLDRGFVLVEDATQPPERQPYEEPTIPPDSIDSERLRAAVSDWLAADPVHSASLDDAIIEAAGVGAGTVNSALIVSVRTLDTPDAIEMDLPVMLSVTLAVDANVDVPLPDDPPNLAPTDIEIQIPGFITLTIPSGTGNEILVEDVDFA